MTFAAWIHFGAENLLTLKRFSKPKIKRLGKESQVLKEKDLIKGLGSSASIPQVLCTCADSMYAGILLNTHLACPLSSILSSPFSESAARFCAASVVTALEDLHKVLYLNNYCFRFLCLLWVVAKVALSFIHFILAFQNGVLYRGVSPDVLMLEQTGQIQVWELLFDFFSTYPCLSVVLMVNLP